MAPAEKNKKCVSSCAAQIHLTNRQRDGRICRRNGRFATKPKGAKPTREKQINVCNDIWLHIFPWLSPAQVGLKVALLSARYDWLASTHFKTRKWAFGRLSIGGNSNGTVKVSFDNMTIDQLSPPNVTNNKIIGFNGIYISFIDASVLAFLERFNPVFQMGITLRFMIRNDAQRSWEFVARQIVPLIGIVNITKLQIRQVHAHSLRNLLKYSPTFLIDCPNLRFVRYIEECDPSTNGGQAVREWLQSPRTDGRPKVLYRSHYSWIVNLHRKEFLEATRSANFIICFPMHDLIEEGDTLAQFPVDNARTNERLAMERVQHNGQSKICMTRAPIERDECQWAEWVRDAWQECRVHNVVQFWLRDENIRADIRSD